MLQQRWSRSAALFAATAVVLTACGAAEKGSGNGSGGKLDTGAEFVFADPFQNDTIDPAKNESGFPTRQLDLVYDRLIGISPDGTLVPQLATAWKFTDSKSLVLTLRKGVKFQDGAVFDADAVVKNLQRSMTLPDAKASVTTPASDIASVSATGGDEVTVSLRKPRYSLVYDLAQNLGMMISPDALGGDLNLRAVGAGMYRLVEFKPGVSARYERWDGYWDPDAVKLARFEIRSIPDAQTRLNAVRSGQVTMSLIDENQVEDAKAARLHVQDKPTVSAWTIFLNLKRGDLGDVRVRQAISYAIDRASLVKNLAYGHGEPTVQLFPPGYYAYSPDWSSDRYAYDPDRARSLLAEAGKSGGVDVSFLVLNRPLDKQMAQAIQTMLEKANIRLKLQVVEPARFSVFTDGDVDGFLGRWGGRADPADTLYSNSGAKGFLNPGGGTSDTFEQLMTTIADTADEAQRATLLQQAGAEFAAQQLDIPIFARQSIFADNGCVVGFTPYMVGSDEYRGVGVRAGCK